MARQRGESPVRVPEWLGWLATEPGGEQWLEQVPQIVEECRLRWRLRLGKPYRGNVSYVTRAVTASGSEAVLKVSYPHPDSEHESAALGHWGGRGAARLLDEDRERRALLLERCLPGTILWDESEAVAVQAVAGVLRGLWAHPAGDGPFEPLADAAAAWCDDLLSTYEKAGRPFEVELVDEAIAFMQTARAGEEGDVVLHQDLHGGNVIRRGADWVAIDPKPLVGERAFDLASFIRDRRDVLARDSDAEGIVRNRLTRLCDALGVDVHRARGWALAHALAWGFDARGTFYPEHVLSARLIARC